MVFYFQASNRKKIEKPSNVEKVAFSCMEKICKNDTWKLKYLGFKHFNSMQTFWK